MEAKATSYAFDLQQRWSRLKLLVLLTLYSLSDSIKGCPKTGNLAMARRRKRNIRSEIERAHNRANLKSHIRALGLQSEDEYRGLVPQARFGRRTPQEQSPDPKGAPVRPPPTGRGRAHPHPPANPQPGQYHPPAV